MTSVLSHSPVSGYALYTVKYATLEAIRGLRNVAFSFAISTRYLAFTALFYGKHINQAALIRAGWKIFEISAHRHIAKISTCWADNFTLVLIACNLCSLVPF